MCDLWKKQLSCEFLKTFSFFVRALYLFCSHKVNKGPKYWIFPSFVPQQCHDLFPSNARCLSKVSNPNSSAYCNSLYIVVLQTIPVASHQVTKKSLKNEGKKKPWEGTWEREWGLNRVQSTRPSSLGHFSWPFRSKVHMRAGEAQQTRGSERVGELVNES